MPAQATTKTAAGAKAFVRHFIAVVNFASATGTTRQLKALSSGACDSCHVIVRTIADIYKGGGSIRSDGWKIRSIRLVPKQPVTRPVVKVRLVFTPQRVVPRAGAKPKLFRGGPATSTWYLEPAGEAWVAAWWTLSG